MKQNFIACTSVDIPVDDIILLPSIESNYKQIEEVV